MLQEPHFSYPGFENLFLNPSSIQRLFRTTLLSLFNYFASNLSINIYIYIELSQQRRLATKKKRDIIFMDYLRNYIDISSCMLFEATGDSEIDSGFTSDLTNMGKTASGSSSTADDVEDTGTQVSASFAEDDALSCSCDNLCSDDCDATSICYDGNDEADYDYDYKNDERARLDFMGEHDRHGSEYPDDEDEDEGAVDQVRKADGGVSNVTRKRINSYQPPGGGGEVVGAVMVKNMMELVEAGRPKERKVCRKPELRSQRDRDTDRLFWEACLSS